MKQWRNESGAAAVEFALVVPLLLLLLLGIIEFGRVFNAQMQVTAAAREAARVMAIQKQADLSIATAVADAPGLTPALTPGQVAVAPGSCTTSTDATVTVTYSLRLVAGLFGSSIPLTGRAVMRCGG
ncbi:TadE/TadG family type IV pilus assembly protein [Arthrobacter sp. OAP107]|uniref:TadE/TadG family type IV pilus assembly protein n=1 Tax=Arthrobacter sp. OAP107 TaxID=3156445 RepID=UPI0033999E08